MDYIKLSKEISYALRHAPWEYELEMNEEGFVPLEQLLSALEITKDDVIKVMEISEKKRLELDGDKIRALYGHSIPMHIKKTEGIPPSILYHGTAKRFIPSIKETGLLPMKRQYVHLSVDEETATAVGKRRDNSPVLLKIDTQQAIADGIRFYIGNDKVWLCDKLPAKYISFPEV